MIPGLFSFEIGRRLFAARSGYPASGTKIRFDVHMVVQQKDQASTAPPWESIVTQGVSDHLFRGLLVMDFSTWTAVKRGRIMKMITWGQAVVPAYRRGRYQDTSWACNTRILPLADIYISDAENDTRL